MCKKRRQNTINLNRGAPKAIRFYIGEEEGRYEDQGDQEREKEKPIAGTDTRII